MARTTHEKQLRSRIEVSKYAHTNEVINRLMDTETIFVVQGSYGRVPVIADTEAEAVDRYVEKFFKRIKTEEELSVTDEDE